MRRTIAYLVYTSSMKDPVRIDEEELEKIAEAGKRMGALVFLKQGVVNTSHIVSVVPDGARINEWLRQCDYGVGRGDIYKAEGIKPLRHMYGENTPIALLIEKKTEELELRLTKAPEQLGGEGGYGGGQG